MSRAQQFMLPTRGGLDYAKKVMAYNPFAYYTLGEAVGETTAVDQIDSPNQDGLYSGTVTLGQPGIGDGRTSGLINQGVLNVDSVTFEGNFSGKTGGAGGWAKTPSYNDGATHYFMRYYRSNDDRIYFRKDTTNDQLLLYFQGGGASAATVVASVSITDNTWFHWFATWSDDSNADELKLFINGSQVGSTATTLGTFANGALVIATIGDDHPTPGASAWAGNFQHTPVFNYVPTPSDIADMANL